jgi:hypothetical protein
MFLSISSYTNHQTDLLCATATIALKKILCLWYTLCFGSVVVPVYMLHRCNVAKNGDAPSPAHVNARVRPIADDRGGGAPPKNYVACVAQFMHEYMGGP